MNVIFLILLVIGAVLFFLEVIRVPSRISLIAAGLFCWILVPLISLIDTFV